MLRHHARPMKRTLSVVFLMVLALPAAAAKRRAVGKPVQYPPCGMVTGTAAVTFTYDWGANLTQTAEPLHGNAYTYGLAAMADEPDTLMAWHRDDLLISTDAGCSWRVVASNSEWDFPPRLTPAPGGRMYVWSDNRMFLLRYDSRGLRALKPPAAFVGFEADRTNGERLRAAGDDGKIWESTDAGESWTMVGGLASDPAPFYRFAFNPSNLNHIIAGTLVTGAHVSRDGGQTWTRSILGTTAQANAFEIAISPADPNRVWIEGIDLATSLRHIWVSSDGGNTFEAVVHEADGVNLRNGNLLAPHPTNKDVLFFAFGMAFQGYGTDIYRYDHRSRTLTLRHNDHDDVNAIVFSSRDPNLMYLGLEAEGAH